MGAILSAHPVRGELNRTFNATLMDRLQHGYKLFKVASLVQYVFAQKCGYLAAYKMTIFMYSFQARSQVLRFVGGAKYISGREDFRSYYM